MTVDLEALQALYERADDYEFAGVLASQWEALRAELLQLRQDARRAEPQLICPRCGVDRYKRECSDHVGCPLTGQALNES